MERLGLAVLVLGLGAMLAALVIHTLRASRQRDMKRAALFDDCRNLLQSPRVQTSSSGFPRLGGQYRGQSFDLQAVPDTLTFRKLPVLWVLVTLPVPLPLRATLDLMIRPRGIETFSNFQTLSEQVAAPSGFPADCAIRSDNASAMLPEEVLRPHLGIFTDERVKELVVSPKGLRISYLAEEANRGRYLIFRDAELGQLPFEAARLEPIMTALLALHADILSTQSDKARE